MPLLSTGASAGAAGAFGPAVRLQTDAAAGASWVRVAGTPSGDAASVWIQSDAYGSFVWASVYAPTGGWSPPWRIQVSSNGKSMTSEVAMNANGTAAAVWVRQSDSCLSCLEVWAARFEPAWGWDVDQRLDIVDGDVGSTPVVAVDGAGDVIAAWTQFDGSHYNIYASRYSVGSGWRAAATIETYSAGDAFSPSLGIDEAGNAIVLWRQYDGNNWSAAANRYAVGPGWGSASYLETNTTGDVYQPRLAVSASGEAWAVWDYQGDGGSGEWVDHYVPGAGWAGATGVEFTIYGISILGRVAIAPNGNASVIWIHQALGGGPDIWARTYTAAGGWAPAVQVEATGAADEPEVAMGSDASAMVVFRSTNGAFATSMATRRDPTTGWGPVVPFAPSNASSERPWVAARGAGGFVLGWSAYNNSEAWQAWVRFYDVADTRAPVLSITSPADGSTVGQAQVRVAGATEAGASVAVNGYAAAVAADGSFSITVPLGPGANVVTVTATDAAANTATVTRTVTYNDPLPAIEAQLAAANANATAAQAAAASAETQLAAAQADAAAARASANATQAQLGTTQTQLTSAQAQLAATQVSLAATQADLAATQVRVNQTRGTTTSGGDTTLPLLLGVGAMAIGAGGLVVGARAGSAVARAGRRHEEAPPPAQGNK